MGHIGRVHPPLRALERLSAAHLDDLLALYETTWWAAGRSRRDVERMLEGSVWVALADADDHLVAFARAVTDRVYKALVLDVVVDRARHGTGIGRRIMDLLVGHPELAQVRHFELYCKPDMAPFYERWGFTDDTGDIVFMRRTRA